MALLNRWNSAIDGLNVHCGSRSLCVKNWLLGAQIVSLERGWKIKNLSTASRPALSKWNCSVLSTSLEEAIVGKPDCDDSSGREVIGEEETASEAPLLSALRECAEMDAASFHFPGHRRGSGAPPVMEALIGKSAFAADLPELPELDNLHAAEGVILEAQCKAARLFGAEQTWFLVNGSTCGIQAAVMATCAPGEYLILPRNVHMSAVSAMVLSGALPKYVSPISDSTWGVAHGVQIAQFEAAIREIRSTGGKIGALLVVSPTYFGICSLIRDLAQVCHAQDIPLIIDEAHGAHFRFHSKLPQTALEQGADIAVQSTHKVLGSLTQSAMLHAQGSRINRARLAQCLQMLQSSSPSYLLLASLDASRAHMEVNRQDSKLDAALSLAFMVRNALQQLPGLMILDLASMPSDAVAESSIAGTDPLRITVGLWGLGLTGFEADDILRFEFGVIAELPSLRSITFAVSVGSSHRDATRLIDSFTALSSRFACRTDQIVGPISNPLLQDQAIVWENQLMYLSPREAFYSKSEKIMVECALGRVSADLLCPYPPGIAVLTPGEVITKEAVDYIQAVIAAGGAVSGAIDDDFKSVRVLL